MASDTFALVICPQPILRYAIRTTFSGNGISSIESGTLEDGLVHLGQRRVSMVLLDSASIVSAQDGIQTFAMIRGRFPEVAIILFTDNGQVPFGEGLQSAANGVVSRDDQPHALLDMCSWVRNGCHGFWISPVMAARYLHQRIVAYRHRLTERELHVLRLLDRTNREIAVDLCLSVGTVKNYVSILYDKLGVRSRAEALKVRSEINIRYPDRSMMKTFNVE